MGFLRAPRAPPAYYDACAMTYRDSFETCPRCRVALVDAGSVRTCTACRGQWVLEPILAEMVLQMLPPGELSRLELATLERGGEGLACPTCGERMRETTIHSLLLDRCPRQLGVWFDGEELEVALHRVASRGMPAVPDAPAPPPPPTTGRVPAEIAFTIHAPGDVLREVTTREPIIKIGRLASMHVRIANDDRVSRMHAVIEVADPPVIIDLGSADGTLVNGARIDKQALRSGDQILVGATTLTVTF